MGLSITDKGPRLSHVTYVQAPGTNLGQHQLAREPTDIQTETSLPNIPVCQGESSCDSHRRLTATLAKNRTASVLHPAAPVRRRETPRIPCHELGLRIGPEDRVPGSQLSSHRLARDLTLSLQYRHVQAPGTNLGQHQLAREPTDIQTETSLPNIPVCQGESSCDSHRRLTATLAKNRTASVLHPAAPVRRRETPRIPCHELGLRIGPDNRVPGSQLSSHRLCPSFTCPRSACGVLQRH